MTPTRPLTPADLDYLAKSWITPELATEARLFRVANLEGAALLGFGDQARRDCAGIVFPYFTPGQPEPISYRIRRDHPEIDPASGKPRSKYLGELQRRNRLYFAPGTPPELLTDRTRPLVITEGEKKALALWRLAHHDTTTPPRFLPIGLSGIQNWQGTIGKDRNSEGQRTTQTGPLPEWSTITLEQRPVYVLFDADVAGRFDLREARRRFCEWLQRIKKAVPRIVDIPAEAQAKGIDDLLMQWSPERVLSLIDDAPPYDIMAEVKGLIEAAAAENNFEVLTQPKARRLWGSLDAGQQTATKALLRTSFPKEFHAPDFNRMVADEIRRRDDRRRKMSESEDYPVYAGRKYDAHTSGMIRWKTQESPELLSNFSARITAAVIRDDGEEQERAFRLKCSIKNRTREVVVAAAKFAEMKWIIDQLGHDAIVYPGSEQHLRVAIQQLSQDTEEQHMYSHTGWAKQEDQWYYLHAGGGIGAAGAAPVEVELDSRMRLFELPAPVEGEELARHIRASLAMLEVAPESVTLPVYAAIWRAPLGRVQLSVFLSGQTGEGKSQIAALAQQHYGAAMTAANLPANWTWTPNALEGIAHKAKDAVLVIDDFIPAGSAQDVSRLQQTAERIFRAQGNNSGRGRMTATGQLRPQKSPRGLVIATGEDIPKNHSLRARLFLVELAAGAMQWAKLSSAQRAALAGEYAGAMSGYVRWLAPQMADLQKTLVTRVEEIRQDLFAAGAHKRTPDNIAHLVVGLEQFCRYATEARALADAAAADLMQRARRTFLSLASRQGEEEQSTEPTALYLQWLMAAMRSGRAHLAQLPENTAPGSDPVAWGWKKLGNEHIPDGRLIGWMDEEQSHIYLDPAAAYAVVQSIAKDSGDHFATSPGTLHRRLKEKGLLARTDESRQTVTVRKTIHGQSLKVLDFAIATLSTPPENTRQNRQADKRTPEAEILSGFDGRQNGPKNGNRQSATSLESEGQVTNVGFVGNSPEDRAPTKFDEFPPGLMSETPPPPEQTPDKETRQKRRKVSI